MENTNILRLSAKIANNRFEWTHCDDCWRTGRYSCTKNYFHWTLCKFNA